MAKKLWCSIWPTGPLAVTVADGNNLVTTSKCEDFQWKFNNTIFTTDVMLLPLGGCEMGALPVNIRPYRHPPTQKDAIEAMIKELLEAGVIKKSHSPFASPIVMVKKIILGGCVLMNRKLNKQTIKDMFPIHIIEELIDELHGAKLFTKLDLRSGYHQIKMNVADVVKTAFRTQEGHYEFIVMPFGLTNAPSTFQSLMNEHVPTSLKQLRGFLGLTGYYRRFIKGFAMITRPLTHLLKKGVYEWNSAAQSAFEDLKQAMISAPFLKLFDFNKEFTIETYASGGGIGAVLLQGGHLIVFLSKTLSVKHQLMSTYEKELLALVQALEKWIGYLFDRHFKIKTDHISLKYLVDQRMSTPTQLKWLPKLIGFDFEIVYKKGVDNVTTDALSRMQNLRELLSIMGTSTLQSSSNEHGHYTWHNEQLGRKGKLMVGNDEVVRKELLQHVHGGTIGGH
ncbi:putative mitochondrial protein [Tanacetum coccineum]